MFAVEKKNWANQKIQKESQDKIIKNIRNLIKLEKENEATKDRIIRDFKTLFEQQEEGDCYKPVRVVNVWNNDYLEYENNENRKKNLSIK